MLATSVARRISSLTSALVSLGLLLSLLLLAVGIPLPTVDG
jgi:hypothetical protein